MLFSMLHIFPERSRNEDQDKHPAAAIITCSAGLNGELFTVCLVNLILKCYIEAH